MKCPNKSNPGVQENAQKSLEKYRATHKKQQEKNSKKRNLVTTNLSEFDNIYQQRIQEQVLQSNTKSKVGDATSVISAVTSTSQQSKTQDPQREAQCWLYIHRRRSGTCSWKPTQGNNADQHPEQLTAYCPTVGNHFGLS